MIDDAVCKIDDATLWVEPPATPFAPQNSIILTANGGVGFQVGGVVIVKPLREWFELAAHELPKPEPI